MQYANTGPAYDQKKNNKVDKRNVFAIRGLENLINGSKYF